MRVVRVRGEAIFVSRDSTQLHGHRMRRPALAVCRTGCEAMLNLPNPALSTLTTQASNLNLADRNPTTPEPYNLSPLPYVTQVSVVNLLWRDAGPLLGENGSGSKGCQ